jgi:hypothetical protein
MDRSCYKTLKGSKSQDLNLDFLIYLLDVLDFANFSAKNTVQHIKM